jgi:GT2 family glycosyltransferase
MNQSLTYIIIPVHNRREITLKCLHNLAVNGDLESYSVIVVDDGSTDGTAVAIRQNYPNVIILEGDGNLWWTGGITKGMEYAYQQGAEYLIWLNDDCYPAKDAISKLLEFCRHHPKTIVGGQSLDPQTLEPSYGGIITHRNKIIPVYAPPDNSIECQGLNGNLVCVPVSVITLIGYPNAQLYPHYHGDTIYTHIAWKKGYKLIVLGAALALCHNDHLVISWLVPERPLWSYWQDYFRIKSPFYWRGELNYYREMFGIFGVFFYLYQRIIKLIAFTIIDVIIPLKIRQKIKQSKTSETSVRNPIN